MKLRDDIDGNEIQSGDLVAYAYHNHLDKSYYLYTTFSGLTVLSCCKAGNKIDYSRCSSYQEHYDKWYLRRAVNMLIVEKQPDNIPERLKRFIRK